jgi:hypothetical protein
MEWASDEWKGGANMAEIDNTREWTNEDQRNDRMIPERPVSEQHWNQGNTQVDAIPGLNYRPGQRS